MGRKSVGYGYKISVERILTCRILFPKKCLLFRTECRKCTLTNRMHFWVHASAPALDCIKNNLGAQNFFPGFQTGSKLTLTGDGISNFPQ